MNAASIAQHARRARPSRLVLVPIVSAAAALVATGVPAASTADEHGPRPSASAATASVYVKDALGARHRRPRTFDFSANGDLVGKKLRWSGWGRGVTTARGFLVESPRPAGSPGVTLRGTVRFSRVVTCPDGRYYARARVTLDRPSKALWIPKNLNIIPC